MTNVVGTQTLLDAALRHKLRRFLHVSTDEVYGSIHDGSWPETHPFAQLAVLGDQGASPTCWRWYDRTHGLTLCHPLLQQLRALPVPGEGHSALRHQPHRRRVSTAVRGRPQHPRLATRRRSLPRYSLVLAGGRTAEVYNIGGGTEMSNRRLTELLLDAVGADWSRVEQVTDRLGHDLRYSVDISKIADELGYSPQVDFRRTGCPDRRLVPGQPTLVGAAEVARGPGRLSGRST